MGYQDDGSAGEEISYGLKESSLRAGIEGSGRFVQNDQFGVPEERPRQGEALPLATLQVASAEELWPKVCVVAAGVVARGIETPLLAQRPFGCPLCRMPVPIGPWRCFLRAERK